MGDDEQVICGVKCPEHGEPCSIIVRGAFAEEADELANFLLGSKKQRKTEEQRVAEHNREGHTCFAPCKTGGKPHSFKTPHRAGAP